MEPQVTNVVWTGNSGTVVTEYPRFFLARVVPTKQPPGVPNDKPYWEAHDRVELSGDAENRNLDLIPTGGVTNRNLSTKADAKAWCAERVSR